MIAIFEICGLLWISILGIFYWYCFGSQLICKNFLGQSDYRIFKLEFLGKYTRHSIFVHLEVHSLRLETDHVILQL